MKSASVNSSESHWDSNGGVPDPPRVLMVDDHPANLMALEAVLGPLGATLVRAHSGEEALARVAEQDFAVVLLDLRMPGLSGIQTAAMMREKRSAPYPPVIILTAALPELQEIKAAYASGVVDFLQKPYAGEVLAAKVSVFLRLFEQREMLRLYDHALRKKFEQELVGIVSHDLRSPLNAIVLSAEVGLRRADATDSTRALLETIRSAAGRATRLIHDLLDYTQVLHGTALRLRPRIFCLFTLAQEVVNEVRIAFPSREFLVEREGSTEGLWDRDRVAQLITNLVSNASTYGNDAPIVVRVIGNQSEVRLEVHNEGEPIAAEVIPELFQPLKRSSGKGARGSIGLGLFIANEVVRAHGGLLEARSAAEEGTTFVVTLPRLAEARADRAQPGAFLITADI